MNGLNYYGVFSAGQGYSGSSEQYAIALNKLARVSFMNLNPNVPDINISDEGRKVMSNPFKLEDVGISYGFPNQFTSMQHNKFRVGFTMFETTKLPSGSNDWTGETGDPAKAINDTCDLLFVPSQDSRLTFMRHGVTVPIEVIHNGVHPSTFPYMERNRKPGHKFTFLIMGTLTIRKNSGAVISAFIDLFKNTDDVRLIVKTQSGTHGHLEFDKSLGDITIIDQVYDHDQMTALMEEADCFVFPTHGEGFGMPPIEAMATGLPTIIAANSGMLEYMDARYNLPVRSYEMEPAVRYPKRWGDVGYWWKPDWEDLRTKMLWVYSHQAEAREMGKRASEWIREEYNYDRIAQQMLDAIEKHRAAL